MRPTVQARPGKDAAYGTLLRAKRRELHSKIVSVLQRDFSEFVATQPEVLALHCAAAAAAMNKMWSVRTMP